LIIREHNIDPTVNIMRLLGTSTTQWLRINTSATPLRPSEKITNLEHEYLVDMYDVKPIPDGEITYITKPGILSFDIECYSDNHNMMPNKKMPKDVVYIIACCYQQYMLPETRRNVCLVLGEYDASKITKGEIRQFKDERSLITGFGQLIAELNPAVLTGHNIFGFDYPYINARLDRLINGEWYPCSMIKNRMVKLITNAWESSAYGRMETNYLDCEGRISFDILPYFRRNAKLDNYKLDTIAKTVLGDKEGKFDMPPKRMFAIYKSIMETSSLPLDDERRVRAISDYTDIINYAVQDAELPIRIFDKNIIWLATVQLANVAKVTPFQVISRGLGVRGFNMMMQENHKAGIILDERQTPIPPFDGGFVGKPIPNLYDNVMCFDFKSLYPSIIIAYNLCPTTFVPPDRWSAVNPNHCWIFEWYSEYEPGKTNSKYNINVLDDDEDDSDSDDEDEPEAKKTLTYHHKYVFYRGGPEKLEDRTEEDKKNIEASIGILPKILIELINSRDAVKAKLAATADKTLKMVYSATELALKVSANSVYGITGAKEGRTPCVEVALCTTYIGRTSINGVNNYLKEKYGAKVVYNDTDSSMVTIDGLSGPPLMVEGKRLANEISDVFAPLKIEFEKAGRMLAICPKKYVFWQYDKFGNPSMKPEEDSDGNPTGKMKKCNILYKGVVATRRDNSPWLRRTYKILLDHILEKGSLDEALGIVFGAIDDLVRGKIPIDDLVVTKQLRAEYKSQTATMAVFASELTRIGSPAAAGERIPFVVVKDQLGRDRIGHKMRSLDLYNQDRRQKYDGDESIIVEPIDVDYYIEKGFMKPIQQLLSVAYRNDIEVAEIKNNFTDMEITYKHLFNSGQCKYREQLMNAINLYPLPHSPGDTVESIQNYISIFEMQMKYLSEVAKGKTNMKKLISKHYNRYLLPDMRINSIMVKNYLRYRKYHKAMLESLVYSMALRDLSPEIMYRQMQSINYIENMIEQRRRQSLA